MISKFDASICALLVTGVLQAHNWQTVVVAVTVFATVLRRARIRSEAR